jgi:hypothetical protein
LIFDPFPSAVIERTVIAERSEPGKSIREVRLITFPNLEAFHSYRADADLASLGVCAWRALRTLYVRD